jgi:hypothetical protein
MLGLKDQPLFYIVSKIKQRLSKLNISLDFLDLFV